MLRPSCCVRPLGCTPQARCGQPALSTACASPPRWNLSIVLDLCTSKAFAAHPRRPRSFWWCCPERAGASPLWTAPCPPLRSQLLRWRRSMRPGCSAPPLQRPQRCTTCPTKSFDRWGAVGLCNLGWPLDCARLSCRPAPALCLLACRGSEIMLAPVSGSSPRADRCSLGARRWHRGQGSSAQRPPPPRCWWPAARSWRRRASACPTVSALNCTTPHQLHRHAKRKPPAMPKMQPHMVVWSMADMEQPITARHSLFWALL